MIKLGELVVKKGFITPQQLQMALDECHGSGDILGKTLVRLNMMTGEQLMESLAEQMGLPFYPVLRSLVIAPEVTRAVPAKFVWHYKFMPLKLVGKTVTIAVSDPLAVWMAEDLKLHLGFDVERVMSTEKEIQACMRKYYGVGSETVEEILARPNAPLTDLREKAAAEIEGAGRSDQDASVVKLVNQILTEAVTARATDVHIEIFREKATVRQRIDGILYEMRMSDQIRQLYGAVVSRIKILSSLNVVEKRLPQDGRAIIKVKDESVDLRVSVVPSIYGENVVIRILPIQLLFNLDHLGFSREDLAILAEQMHKPHGIIFLTGPTGSGKTTTLYACLSRLNKEQVKIVTIEDPVEYELPGIMQIQIRPEIGLTFASSLRSILRHDPDIMMVGEVRDHETAELAIRTALTGHLIFSTLHTNDAPSGAPRLMDIGLEPYLVASSVNAFIAQRLVRMICPDCKEEVTDRGPVPDSLKGVRIYQGRGCEKCQSIGYKGRTAIYEILPVQDEIQELIIRKASAGQIRQKAREMGFKTLYDAGVERIRQGMTTWQEVMRVTEFD